MTTRSPKTIQEYDSVKLLRALPDLKGRLVPAGSIGVVVDVNNVPHGEPVAFMVEITCGPEMDFSYCDALVTAAEADLEA